MASLMGSLCSPKDFSDGHQIKHCEMRQQIIISCLPGLESRDWWKRCRFAPEKGTEYWAAKPKGAKKNTVTACVMRGCHQVISLGRAVGVSRCPGVVMLGFFLLGEGDQSDSAVS